MTRIASALVCVTAFVVAAVSIPDAQGRAGAPPQGRGRGAGGGRGAGTIERIVVHGKSLEGNLEGDSADRAVSVYLPPSYGADQKRRFPTIYLLHGLGGTESTFLEPRAELQQSADRLAAAQGFNEFIVVTPNAFTLHGGSLYTASTTTGDWERYVAEDLVAYIDTNYRTVAQRMSRGIAGHSAGGYGALRIAMKRPDVFAHVYAMSACCAAPVELPPDVLAAAESIRTREQADATPRSTVHAMAAAWSPNPKNPPLFVDLPTNSGKALPQIVAKWNANALVPMVGQYVSNLNQYYAIGMEIGTADPLLEQNRQLHSTMTRLRIPHMFEEYDGGHADRLRERLESSLLPFFSRSLPK
jgi:S-formylglutathione hydrolase FrmB